MSKGVIPDYELEDAFRGTNFGEVDRRKPLEASVLKKAMGYYCGHTITTIMQGIGLIGKNGTVLRRGKMLLRDSYDHLVREGG